MVDAVERLKQVPGEHDVLDQLRHMSVADHVAPSRGEREVLEHGLTAERGAGVHAELDVANQVLERSLPRSDVGVGHAHDRRVAERDGPGVARRPLAQAGGRFARVQPADQHTLTDERCVLGRRALVVVGQGAPQPGGRTIVPDIQDRFAEASAQRHHRPRLRVLVHEIRLGQVAERLVDEDAGHFRIQHHGIGAAADRGRVEQGHGPLGGAPKSRREAVDAAPTFAQADRFEPLLDGPVAAGDGRPGDDDLRAQLVQHRPLGVHIPDLAHLVVVGRLGIHDAPRNGKHLAVVALEQPLLLRQRDAAHVPIQVEQRVGLRGGGVREPDRLVDAHRARQLVGPGHHGGQPVEGGEGRDAPAAAGAERPHESAYVLAGGGGFEPLAAVLDSGAPGAFDADFGVIGAGLAQRPGESVLHAPGSRSFSA